MVEIKFNLDEETYAEIRGLKSRKIWTWVDCIKELLKRCR